MKLLNISLEIEKKNTYIYVCMCVFVYCIYIYIEGVVAAALLQFTLFPNEIGTGRSAYGTLSSSSSSSSSSSIFFILTVYFRSRSRKPARSDSTAALGRNFMHSVLFQSHSIFHFWNISCSAFFLLCFLLLFLLPPPPLSVFLPSVFFKVLSYHLISSNANFGSVFLMLPIKDGLSSVKFDWDYLKNYLYETIWLI